ncbi:hypothetical protein HDU86_006278 [Geranomyces michiganensis]|nr:hypothetical protein HDU86_006278 [Geranomyces michiganensis]
MPPKRKSSSTTLEALAEVSPTTSRYQLRSRGPALAIDLDSVSESSRPSMIPIAKHRSPVTVTIAWALNGVSGEITVTSTTTIAEIKQQIAKQQAQPAIRLAHDRKEWDNGAVVLCDHIKHLLASATTTPSPTTLQPRVVVDLLPDPAIFTFLPVELLEPKWDRHYPVTASSQHAARGGKPYTRPGGWMRFGLKVTGKYKDDKWLGPPGPRDTGDGEEWFVTYHGTAHQSAASIARQGYNTGTVWSSTAIMDTAGYSAKGPFFPSPNKGYAIVMQNRVSPKFAVSQGGSIYTVAQKYIRPYAILISASPQCNYNRYGMYGYGY